MAADSDNDPLKITDIHEEIHRLFAKHGYPWLTNRLPIGRMIAWGKEQAERLGIDEDLLVPRVRTVFWAAAHIQISLGYALIARQSVEFPKGRMGTAYKLDDLPNVLTVPDQYFWYHAYMTSECLYRCWERLTSLLCTACFPSSTEKLYFDGLANKIHREGRLSVNPAMRLLLKQRKNWNRVCGDRNRLSHHDSSPMAELNIVGQVSTIYGPDGVPAPKLQFRYASADEELDKLRNRYKALVPAIEAVQAFIESM